MKQISFDLKKNASNCGDNDDDCSSDESGSSQLCSDCKEYFSFRDQRDQLSEKLFTLKKKIDHKKARQEQHQQEQQYMNFLIQQQQIEREKWQRHQEMQYKMLHLQQMQQQLQVNRLNTRNSNLKKAKSFCSNEASSARKKEPIRVRFVEILHSKEKVDDKQCGLGNDTISTSLSKYRFKKPN
jgi:hypothetical protein